ncbi:hypothetical protein [Actinomyces ruminis]|uniref:hypothetical protein n=1 Tax=Actinomyces ruminis TaxID=1937003 RepID=UPI001178B0A5|nr:hypothetical protein [Actinomyces ruminis]
MGVYVVPALAMTVVLVLAAWPAAIVMVTEVRHAHVVSVVRLALVVVARKWYLSLLNLLVMVGTLLGLIAQPFLVAALGSGFLLHLVWANARWMVLPSITSKAVDAERRPVADRASYRR